MDTILSMLILLSFMSTPFWIEINSNQEKNQIKEHYLSVTKKTYDELKENNYSLALHKATSKCYKIGSKKYCPKYPEEIIYFGKASWYGKRFHGRNTSTGEKYNMYQYTAASPTLPMGTIVKVINRDNGKDLNVKINDRGPFANDRIIDLSKKAAIELGFHEQGICDVAIKILSIEENAKIIYKL